ncbi:BTAD domain-containing putative transcriptional regulator [Streptomyces sp. JW3]|uniref:BTAD domain-containing putative transcriptional regulator n=1 Tax=Streptomyces sp. JW3 TaxID=3456955 RepID=UPI003FA415A3
MPMSATTTWPAAGPLGDPERQVLAAVGRGLRDDEVAAALGLSEDAVAECLARIRVTLGLRDRAAVIVHAFDCGLAVPGRDPRARPVRAAAAKVRISLLGPLQAWRDGRPLELGHLRQQAVLAALALGAGRSLSQRELRADVWGPESPAANVVPVYVYRLRKALRGGGAPEPVIEHGLRGYRLAPGAVDVDVARMEDQISGVGAAERAGDAREAVRRCARALELFRGEPLTGLPGPLAELERLRLTGHRTALVQRKAAWQLRLGLDAEAIAELSALTAAHPHDEPAAALLMWALYRSGRQADALGVFERARRLLDDDLGVEPGRMLRRVHRMILRGDEAGPVPVPAAGSVPGP